jgi:hypothetical protein
MTVKPLLFAAAALGVCGFADAADAPNSGIALTQGELRWEEQPGRPGKAAPLWGKQDGPHSELVMRPAKFQAALHTHTATVRRVVVSGGFTYGLKGERGKEYGPGSLIVTPAGLAHHDGCPDGCVIFVEWDGKYDSTSVK